MSTSSQDGRLSLTDLPYLTDYTREELERAADEWPALQRYLGFLKRTPENDMDRLRERRQKDWLRCALATYYDRAPARDICFFWSKAAEHLIQEAWQLSGCDQYDVCILALGKLGAEELNLSSDVDLILVRADEASIEIKPVREFQKILTEFTTYGFCLRVDLTLRPGGGASTLVPSVSEFENHYGYHGEMWERLAYVRMRVIAGPKDLSESILRFSKKFSFRRHLDYTLLDDLKSLRAKIRAEKFESKPDCFHLKLGEGGIRELELFVHALQVIHGGRNVSLQTHSTTTALERIRDLRLLPQDEVDFLIQAYWYLRDLENRLHAFEDQQTYLIDLSKGHPALGTTFKERLQNTTAKVSSIATSLFGETDAANAFPLHLDEQKKWLQEKGFSSESREETWPALLTATALSRRSDQDEKARMTFLQGFVSRLAESRLDRDLGLSLLLDFVRSVRVKASFFTLLNRETQVRDNLATLFSISPYLGSILTSRPELIDEFIFRKQAEPSADLNLLLDELAERRLLAELIAANQFLVDRDLANLSINLSSNADSICLTLLEHLKREYGPSDLGLIAMGKWGGRELGLRSDLDFIFVTLQTPNANDHRIAKRFLSRITEPHRGGAIYSIDMRLRPSGHAGPILVSQDELASYLREKAAAWERQAYLRARPLLNLNFHPAQIGARRGLSSEDRDELRMIKQKLFISSGPGELDLKLHPGGLADIEFTAQIALLARGEFSLDTSTSDMIHYLERVDSNWQKVGPRLRESYNRLRRIEQLFQLTTRQSGSKIRVKSDEFKRLALVLDQAPADLEATVRSSFVQIDEDLRVVRTLAE